MRQPGPLRGTWRIRDVSPANFTFRFWPESGLKLRVNYGGGMFALLRYSCIGRSDHYGKLEVIYKLDLLRGMLRVERTNHRDAKNSLIRTYHPNDQNFAVVLREMQPLMGHVRDYLRIGNNPVTSHSRLLLKVISIIDQICGPAQPFEPHPEHTPLVQVLQFPPDVP